MKNAKKIEINNIEIYIDWMIVLLWKLIDIIQVFLNQLIFNHHQFIHLEIELHLKQLLIQFDRHHQGIVLLIHQYH